VQALDSSEFTVLMSALYEACANIVEHGYRGDAGSRIQLGFVPPLEEAARNGDNLQSHMEFVIRDQGRPFSADNWMGSDFSDPQVRRRGRGFGLDIIHRAMVHVEYRPATPEGNITLLVFDPAKHAKERKLRYA
jgi:anti-sigma regulatory factor (Ser/Thr protein kinase)